MFYLYEGNNKDLPTTEDYLNFRWSEDEVLFSITRKGQAAVIHFTARKLRRIQEAVDEFCEYVFHSCEWCKMIIGLAEKHSIVKLGKKCGFSEVGHKDNVKIMMRERSWDS